MREFSVVNVGMESINLVAKESNKDSVFATRKNKFMNLYKRIWCKFKEHDWRVYPLCEHELTPWVKKCSRCGEEHVGRMNEYGKITYDKY